MRGAVTQATLLEAGAVGLGAVSMALVGSVAADVTGLFAASVLAGVGLWLLPRKRSQAKSEFRARTEELRGRLLTALRDEFQREQMVPAFGNVGFAISVGNIDIANFDPQTSPYGWHIIKRLK